MGSTPNRLRFEDSGDSGLWLRTSAGSIRLNNGEPSGHDSYSIGPRWDLSGDGSWVTWRGQGSIWLPPDFRPQVSDISRDGSAIAIGRPTGHVVVLRMSMDVLFT
ncbi:hypothetical protein B0T24DRAFT_631222 [Lasiosphaeria ovina]|uniref:Uncharacterized protein n=1 Tax=Lasiosphaeria ovina TaxID=92902 RepID=A0AAE0N341_9PEZI|nr:hypothetical protein B0T24DRAFT_631222 [Lasiosphaeria ovina]